VLNDHDMTKRQEAVLGKGKKQNKNTVNYCLSSQNSHNLV